MKTRVAMLSSVCGRALSEVAWSRSQQWAMLKSYSRTTIFCPMAGSSSGSRRMRRMQSDSGHGIGWRVVISIGRVEWKEC